MPYRYAKERPTLPAGYQFGDARPMTRGLTLIVTIPAAGDWRAPHENDAERLARQAQRTGDEAV